MLMCERDKIHLDCDAVVDKIFPTWIITLDSIVSLAFVFGSVVCGWSSVAINLWISYKKRKMDSIRRMRIPTHEDDDEDEGSESDDEDEDEGDGSDDDYQARRNKHH